MIAVLCAVGLVAGAGWDAAQGRADDGGSLAEEPFDVHPEWEGFRNRLLPASLPKVNQSFGYTLSQWAGGRSAGEIGGTVERCATPAWYAKAIPTRTLSDRLTASGRFAVRSAEASSGTMIGWFHTTSRGWRTPNSLGLRIDGNGGKYWVFFEYGTADSQTGGAGAFEGERYQTTPTPPFMADGSSHHWTLDYEPPAAAGPGCITLRIDERTYELAVPAEHIQSGATFDHFGIWNVQIAGEAMQLYVDDLKINGREEVFDEDPRWEGRGNRASFVPRVIRPYHDFGFSDTRYAAGRRGEIGGVVFRDERPAYYAAPVGPLSLDQPLSAHGRIALREAASDSGVGLGWFDSASKRSDRAPENPVRQKNYLGIILEGPSRVGHYFRAAYSNAVGRGEAPTEDPRTGEARPLIRPNGRVHRWSIRYEPQESGGWIAVSLDEARHRLEVRPEDRAAGAAFDRFGIFNLQAGGHHVEVYLDDIAYTRQVPQ